MSTLYMTCS